MKSILQVALLEEELAGRRSFWRRQRHREDELTEVESKLYRQLMEDEYVTAYHVQEQLENIQEGKHFKPAEYHGYVKFILLRFVKYSLWNLMFTKKLFLWQNHSFITTKFVPGRYNLKLQANKINFENCSAQQYFENPHRNPFQSSSLLAIRTFFRIYCVIEMLLYYFKRYFLDFTEFSVRFLCLNLA